MYTIYKKIPLLELDFFMVKNTLIQYLIISLTDVLGIGSITSDYSPKKSLYWTGLFCNSKNTLVNKHWLLLEIRTIMSNNKSFWIQKEKSYYSFFHPNPNKSIKHLHVDPFLLKFSPLLSFLSEIKHLQIYNNNK